MTLTAATTTLLPSWLVQFTALVRLGSVEWLSIADRNRRQLVRHLMGRSFAHGMSVIATILLSATASAFLSFADLTFDCSTRHRKRLGVRWCGKRR
jgi:hypothetical protein